MFCSNCGKDLTGTQGGFCVNCGIKIAGVQPSQKAAETASSAEAEVFCAKCGSRNEANAGFCRNCGETFGAAKKKKGKKFPARILIPAAAVLLVGAGIFCFFAIRRNSTEGTQRKGNRIYYSNLDDDMKLYTMKTDGSEGKLVE